MKRPLSFLLALVLALSLCACAQPDDAAPQQSAAVSLRDEQIPDDNYRNWYEIFVYSFADGDGDRIGDFKGLTEKLDYVADMGYTGIWLMPVMPSPSYHKYDVTDYCDVDPQYGTLDDFRAFLAAAHERNIKVILDLVVNHTSNEHPWFLSAKQGADSPYRDYYNWSDTAQAGYNKAGDSYYESRFVSTMPDLNLDNDAVRDEITEIMRFWLEEIGVDGFRLDAVTSYYTGNRAKNVEFLTWLGETARSIAPDCYIVGEAWEDLYSIADYAQAKIDSFFTFPVSQGDGYLAKILSGNVKNPGLSYGNVTTLLDETLPASTVPAPFLCNHDTNRAASFLGPDVTRQKMALGLLAMMRGNTFVYYGDEIGMTGSGNDPNKRIGMLWTTRAETTWCPPGTTLADYPLPSVAEQQADEASLLNYYREAMHLRLRNPEIARGESRVIDCGNTDLCLIERTWNGSSVLLVLNPSASAHTQALEGELAAYSVLCDQLLADEAMEGVGFDGSALSLPPYSIAVLTRAAS